jgi:hypothetical protein
MIYYLYIKTHCDTGLKYLGQTKLNPLEYKGSGKYWKNHIRKHGNKVSTELIAAFDSIDDVKVAGLFWSQQREASFRGIQKQNIRKYVAPL